MREKLNIGKTALRTPAKSGKENGQSALDEKFRRSRRMVRGQAALAIGTLLVVVILLFAMTSAWYTNVSRTSTLTFHAESWGFDPSNLTVGTGAIAAAPGKSGVVPISVDNSDSTDPVKIYVTVSKTPMGALANRVYFFADTSEIINGESVSRVYVGSRTEDAYAYEILPGATLTLADGFSSDVPIRWKWVYDMQGYYFRGTVHGNTATADEYLRPIEYDLDKATFERTNGVMTGALLTVDGDTVADFLADVTAHDGYSEVVRTASAVTVGGSEYYPVEVDENGVGVWIYLCSYTEIEQAITYDSGLGSNAEFTANVTVAAVSVPSETRTVSTAAELTTALADPDIDVVKLSGDLTVASPISLGSAFEKTLDLGSNTITYAGAETEYSFIAAGEGSRLTVMNGEIVGNGNGSGAGGTVDSVAVSSVGASVTMSGVTASGFDTAVLIADEEGVTGADSEVRITNCTFNMANLGIFIKGNGDSSSARTRLIIDGSTVVGASYAGISGQGADGLWGTDIAINNSTVSGYWTSVYLPARNTNAYIKGSTLTGYTGLVVKGGTVYVDNCTVTGNGGHAAAGSGGGWTDTGDGVYVEAVYNWNASVNVIGGTVNSTYGHALELFGKDGAGSGGIVSSGATLSGGAGASHWNGKGTFTVNGTPVPVS